MENRQEMMYEMEALLRNVVRQLRIEINSLLNHEMTRNEFYILKILQDQGPQKSSALSKQLEVSASHITAITDSLLEKNFISRERSESDRRIIEIEITDFGREKLKELQVKKTDFLFSRFNCYTDEEMNELISLFRKLDRS
ncbi:MarR family transcriptional regulator [Metabacillus sp. GX 13764]|uniref:MarR family winged helix-turn-helix transcriptional regulator n=1 Tax=Metabacillus kandeliae TaxID=2900151 RepID=UPI001E48829F|nr:MarR family transcriptional regulator [Metabacillus kandeliae]MCD7033474.1 MarR family transcriptional regulator [Metabacillus kandeliae]